MRSNAYRLIILLLLPLILFPGRQSRDTLLFTHEGLDLFNVVKSTDPGGKAFYSLEDISYEAGDPFINDFVLSFNRGPDQLMKDDTGRYPVRHASYNAERGGGVSGGGGARFFKADDRVELDTEANLWLTECEDLGSFSIDFRMKPHSLEGTQLLFSRTGNLSGKRNGIEIVLHNRRIAVRLYGIFINNQNLPLDIHLNRGNVLKAGTWHHFMLSYDRLSGKLARYLDGNEEELIYITRTREPYVGVYRPQFYCNDRPLVILGKNYYGILDEFRIAHRHHADLLKETALALDRYKKTGISGRMPINREGVITSPVYELPLSGTQVHNFTWKEKLPRDTFIWMEFRISDYLFIRDDDRPKWYRIRKDQRNIFMKKTEGGEYLRGKYAQWRAHLVPSPDGRQSPVLSNIAMHYRLDLPPGIPEALTVTGTGDERIRLKWRINPESDVLGYRIYYGLQPGKYDGVIGKIGGKRINGGNPGRRGFIEVEITNDIINENKISDSHSPLSYPLLKNTVLYYFSVTAYDDYKPDTPFNHESSPSREVSARPFAGSEID